MMRLDSIWAGYDGSSVLRDVTLVVPDRAVVALLGANGVGKTTLLKVASGLLRPERGSVRVDHADLTGHHIADFAAAGVCHVPEGRAVFGGLTVRENLRLFARGRLTDDALDRVCAAFPRLGERLNQTARTMSGGEQQMLALSAAYLADPRVILLDEVSMGLAPVVVDEIFGFLRLLAEEGRSLLLVEQYVDRVLDIADYVYLMTRGRIGFVGEAREVRNNGELLDFYLV